MGDTLHHYSSSRDKAITHTNDWWVLIAHHIVPQMSPCDTPEGICLYAYVPIASTAWHVHVCTSARRLAQHRLPVIQQHALMGYTVYATYFVPPYFVHIPYFQTSKIRCNPLRVLAYCVLCIAYSAANPYSHLKSSLRIWVAFRIPYSVFRIGSTILGGMFRIPYSVFRIGSTFWVAFRIPYSVSVFRIGSTLGGIPYSVFRIRIPYWE
jgi:hypothetical protein